MRAGKGICALIAALIVASPTAADYRDSYGRGVKAAKNGDWATVRARMQEAIAEEPTAQLRVRLYGQRWEPYLPQYYLGLAAFKQGDCATALAQWRSSSNAAVIGGVPEIKAEQDRDMASCDTRVAQQTKPDSPKTGQTTAPDGGDPPKPPPPKPDPPKQDPPKQDPVKPDPPKPPPPKPPETPIAQRVPGPLLDAFRNYLGGRYADVARINPDSYTDARARAQAYLIRAAARQILAELDNAPAGLDGARADIRAVRAANPNLVPDPALFSPRFRSLYSATR